MKYIELEDQPDIFEEQKDLKVGDKLNISNNVLYYEKQLSILASETKEAKMLDRATHFKFPREVKQLLSLIKEQRHKTEHVLALQFAYAKEKNFPNQTALFDKYCGSISVIADRKFILFNRMRLNKTLHVQEQRKSAMK